MNPQLEWEPFVDAFLRSMEEFPDKRAALLKRMKKRQAFRAAVAHFAKDRPNEALHQLRIACLEAISPKHR